MRKDNTKSVGRINMTRLGTIHTNLTSRTTVNREVVRRVALHLGHQVKKVTLEHNRTKRADCQSARTCCACFGVSLHQSKQNDDHVENTELQMKQHLLIILACSIWLIKKLKIPQVPSTLNLLVTKVERRRQNKTTN